MNAKIVCSCAYAFAMAALDIGPFETECLGRPGNPQRTLQRQMPSDVNSAKNWRAELANVGRSKCLPYCYDSAAMVDP